MAIWDNWFGRGKEETKANPAYSNYASTLRMVGNDQPVYAPRNYQRFSQDAYIRNVVAHRCIDMSAKAIAGIPWKLYTQGKRKEITEHPLLDRLATPNPEQSQFRFIASVIAFYKLSGNSYIYANRLKRSPEPMELWCLRPDRVSIVPSATGVSRYEYKVGQVTNKYAPSEVMHMKMFHPMNDLYGLSEVEVAGALIDQMNAGDDRNTALLQNAARPSAGLFAKEVLSDPEFERLNNQIITEYSGITKSGSPMLFDGDMRWQALGMTPLELDWNGSHGRLARGICIGLDTPSILLGDSENKTYSNYETAVLSWYTGSLLPDTDMLRDELNRWYVPMYEDGDNLLLDYDKAAIEALQENQDGASARATTQWNGTGITLNEYRRIIGQAEIKGGDILKLTTGKDTILIPIERLTEYVEANIERAINPPVPPTPVIAPPMPHPQLPAPTPATVPPDDTAVKTALTIFKAMQEYKITEMQLQQVSGVQHAQPRLLVAPQLSEHYARFERSNSSGTMIEEGSKAAKPKPDATDNAAWQNSDPQVLASITTAKEQGTHWTWNSSQGCCMHCLKNKGVKVLIGTPFPSGAIGTPEHNNCSCTLTIEK